MTKTILDIVVSIIALLIFMPLIIFLIICIFLYDRKSPFYFSKRVGKDNNIYFMIKLRSMIVDADKTGVSSTAGNDSRITYIGKYIRLLKADELMQLFNVIKGDMSLVGPRPNVINEVSHYTDLEKKLLSVKPGITDFASIIFSDESKILMNKKDPDLSYNQLIRPSKSRLGLHYIKCMSLGIDICLIFCTLISIFSRKTALNLTAYLLKVTNADVDLQILALRREKLMYSLPPE